MGVMSIVYCTLGGLEAVVWTDTIQAIVLFAGFILMAVFDIDFSAPSTSGSACGPGRVTATVAADGGSKALLAIGVTKDLTDRLKAGDLIREVAGVVGGGGGGRVARCHGDAGR